MAVSLAFPLLVCLTLVFGFFDGLHGSANVVAAVIYSRALSVPYALFLVAAAAFVGPFLFGVAIAETIGKGLADPSYLTLPVTIAAILAAILWKLLTARWGLPSSASHALVGGLVGAMIASSGVSVLQPGGLLKVTVALAVSPPLGLVAGFLVMRLMLWLTQRATPQINNVFRKGQWVTAVILALSYGTNNAQLTMGVITLGLVTANQSQSFTVPLWVIASSAASLALGILFGGQRVIRTVGGKFYKIRPIHGFTSQLTAAAIILIAAMLGGPVSATEIASSTLIGVGSAERLSKVRWTVFYDMALTWVLTVPATMLAAAILYAGISSLITLL